MKLFLGQIFREALLVVVAERSEPMECRCTGHLINVFVDDYFEDDGTEIGRCTGKFMKDCLLLLGDDGNWHEDNDMCVWAYDELSV